MSEIHVVISHAHEEKVLALAWKNLIELTSQGAVEVWLSSDTTPTGGIELGHEWKEKLYEKLTQAEFVVAILSPASFERPWILWECGVASGVNKSRGIVPIYHKMSLSEMTGPLCTYQAYSGDDPDQIKDVCARFVEKAGLRPQPHHWGSMIGEYLAEKETFRPSQSPSARMIELWTSRLNASMRTDDVRSLAHLVDQFYVAVGGRQPVDMVIHDILSSQFLEHELYDLALSEVDLALNLLPDDTVLLYRRGLILLELKKYSDVQLLWQSTFEKHPQTRDWPELAGLEGRLYRDLYALDHREEHLRRALDAYKRAFKSDRTQYQLGCQAILLAIMADDEQTAGDFMSDVLRCYQKEQERVDAQSSVDFPLGELYIVGRRVDLAEQSYQRGLNRIPRPEKGDLASARESVGRLGALIGESVEGILRMLKEPSQ